MLTKTIVERVITEVAAEHDKVLPPLTDDLLLLNSGLDSLCLAVIVARLEDELHLDPFSTTQDAAFPITLGDLIALYDRVLV